MMSLEHTAASILESLAESYDVSRFVNIINAEMQCKSISYDIVIVPANGRAVWCSIYECILESMLAANGFKNISFTVGDEVSVYFTV